MSDKTCIICLEHPLQHSLDCCHVFCFECIEHMTKSNGERIGTTEYKINCPSCRFEQTIDLAEVEERKKALKKKRKLPVSKLPKLKPKLKRCSPKPKNVMITQIIDVIDLTA